MMEELSWAISLAEEAAVAPVSAASALALEKSAVAGGLVGSTKRGGRDLLWVVGYRSPPFAL